MFGYIRRYLAALGLIAMIAAPPARADEKPTITVSHGVTVVRGHLDTVIVPEDVEVTVVEPVHTSRDGRSQAWLEWVDTYRRARASATVKPRPRVRQPEPPWKYTPSDQTYTPKTDWTYHPKKYRHWL